MRVLLGSKLGMGIPKHSEQQKSKCLSNLRMNQGRCEYHTHQACKLVIHAKTMPFCSKILALFQLWHAHVRKDTYKALPPSLQCSHAGEPGNEASICKYAFNKTF